MTIAELFEYVDAILENVFTNKIKLRWLNQIEAEIQVDVLLMTPEGITQYKETDMGAELLVPAPYDQLYHEYIFWQICLAQQETERANNYVATFNRVYNEYVRMVCETINPGNGLAERVRYYLTAYQIAVKHGYNGSEIEWVESLKGPKGEAGDGIALLGVKESEEELPKPAEPGNAYLVGTTEENNLFVYDNGWHNMGPLRGEQGPQGPQGDPFTFSDFTEAQLKELTGPAGRGITSVLRTSGNGAAGSTDVYTVTYTDGAKTTFSVYNGKDGEDGKTPVKGVDYFDGEDGKTPVKGVDYFDGNDGNGIKSAALNADYTLTLNFDDGTNYTTPSIRGAAGNNGDDGVGIASIKQTTTSSADDGNNVFTVTLTNGTTATFTVQNGSKGSDGKTPVKGVDYFDGEDGKTPVKGVDYDDGTDGVGIKNVVFKESNDVGYIYTINLTDGTAYEFTAPRGPQGTGSGGSGESGSDGVGIQSIQLKEEAATGNTYTIILTDGSTYDFVAPAGGKGEDGEDGLSPTATVYDIEGGSRLSITDANGTTTVDIMDGKDGKDGKTPVKGVDYDDGKNGNDGNGIKSATLNADYTLTLNFDDGTNYTTPSIRGAAGKDGKDGKTPVKGVDYFDGNDGNGIKSAALNADYTLTLNFDDGTNYTTPSIRGAAGNNGDDGVGIASIKQTTTSSADDGNNVFTVTLTNGTTATFTVQNGSKGSDGKTPVKGTDYFTAADKQEIAQQAATMVDIPSGSWNDLKDKPSTFPPATHNQAASTINSGTFDVARIPNLAASKITAGTFAGQVAANSGGQTPGTSLLRNSKIVSSATTPTVNGEINWKYK